MTGHKRWSDWAVAIPEEVRVEVWFNQADDTTYYEQYSRFQRIKTSRIQL